MLPLQAQKVIQIDPLFEYPVPPDNLESLDERCNYLVKVFWDNFDFKNKKAVDQYALNEAFQVYATAFPYAGGKEIQQSLDKLIKNLSSNPGLLMQFEKAAEENLYSIRAQIWSDDLFLKFLDAIIKNKKISDKRKARYINMAGALRESAEGETAPAFWFEDAKRASKQYFPMSTPTMLIFGNPDDTDWRLSRLKMESNSQLAEALEKGKVNVLYIIPNDIDNWQDQVSNYNKRWTVGQSIDAKIHYDIRLNPAIYIINSQGKIAGKNFTPEQATGHLLQLIN